MLFSGACWSLWPWLFMNGVDCALSVAQTHPAPPPHDGINTPCGGGRGGRLFSALHLFLDALGGVLDFFSAALDILADAGNRIASAKREGQCGNEGNDRFHIQSPE